MKNGFFACLSLLVLSCLGAGLADGQDGKLPVLKTLFQQERSSEEDVICFRNNDVLRGKVINETFNLRAPYGDIVIPLARCAGISFEGAQSNTESLVTVNYNRFTGIIQDQTIRFKIGSSGAEIPVRKEKVKFVLFATKAEEASFAKPDSDLYVMSNGDILTAKSADASITIKTDYAEIPVSFAEMDTLDMQGQENVVAIVKKKNGDTMRGSMAAEEITLNLDLGFSIPAIYKDKLSKIVVGQGNTQVLAQFGVRQPIHGESDGAAFPKFGGDTFSSGGKSISVKVSGLAGDVEMKFVEIPAGEFVMGSPSSEKNHDDDESPLHKVKITKPFYLGMHEVTQEQWEAVMGSNPSKFSGNPKRPVENVSWNDCNQFIKKLNEMNLGTFRLPTEAEWEYACRAGAQTRFYWGDDPNDEQIDEYTWYSENSGDSTQDVGQKKPNAWGLFDMSGNGARIGKGITHRER